MKPTFKRTVLKILKIGSIIIGSLLLLMFLLPIMFPQTVNKKINQWVNGNINGKITFSKTRLSFFRHFPALTLTLYNVDLKGSAPFEKDTLIAAKEISLGIDLPSVFRSKININKIYLSNANINLLVDSAGHGNYSIYKSGPKKTTAAPDTGSTSLGIEQILIENSTLVYNDLSIPLKVNARNLNYTGSGDLSKDVFDLHTHTEIQSLDLYYGNQPYIISKKVNADLVTQINTKSLAFVFTKNDLMINQLPVQFTGKFGFIKDGYDMNFKIDSHESDLSDIFTALPAEYQKMVAQTDVDGEGNVQVSLIGKYIAKSNTKPDLDFKFKIRNGFVNNKKSPSPVRNLYLNLESKIPGLNPDSLFVNIDSIYFNIGKDYFGSVIHIKGLNNPDIYARVNSEIDLEQWHNVFGIKPFEVKGRYSLHLLAQGRYAQKIIRNGKKKPDTLITSIPKFTLTSSFKNGYFKLANLPEAVKNISFNLKADCPDNNYKHINIAMDNMNAAVLDNYLKGYFKLSTDDGYPVDADVQTKFHLADIKKFYPIDSLDIRGDLNTDIKIKGKYLPAKKKFPVTTANISLQNGSIQTKYYPHPIQNIQVSTVITNNTGTVNGTRVFIKPISFMFEGEPFWLKADLQNFADLQYNVKAKGKFDIGKIYQVFAVKGYNVDGKIMANVAFKGKQSDARAGHYDKLSNSGSLTVQNITLSSGAFPQPFNISKGVFSFNQDKMMFDSFTAKYGKSQIVLNGAMSNVIDYAMKPGAVLQGDFKFTSDLLVADDFMAYSGTPKAASEAPSGVIVVPKNLNLTFTADVKKLTYQGLGLANAKGQLQVKNGNLSFQQTGFNLIGAPIAMDGSYTNIGPKQAFFNYHISAKDFDIHKAYQQIKLFRDAATAAASAEGLVSLDYKLSGKLNGDMQPIYPSLKGGGTLSAKQLKMHGYKMMDAIGKSTKRDSIGKDGDVSQVELKTTIANNIITIERTKLRMAGFRARFEGQVSFDKAVNIKFRLGLPPLGIIGIPLTITGTEDKPKIHLGSGKKEDELQGTTEDDTND